MAGSQRDVKNRIGSVKNIQKITRAMEMVAAARLRRHDHLTVALRPCSWAVGWMPRPAAAGAGGPMSGSRGLPISASEYKSALLRGSGARGRGGVVRSEISRA